MNRPLGTASEFFTIGRFRERLLRPDIIDRLLLDGDEATAVHTADRQRAAVLLADSNTPTPQQPADQPAATAPHQIAQSLPPALVYKQAPVVETRGNTVALDFGVVLRPGEQLTSLMVRRDGILQPASSPRLPALLDGNSVGTVEVEVPVGESRVHVVAANAHGFSDALAFTVIREKAVESAAPAPTAAPVAPAPGP